MKKWIFTLITYICTLSSLYSLNYTIEAGIETSALPITADFSNQFSLTGFSGETWGTFFFHGKFGLSWQFSDHYLSLSAYDNGSLPPGASNYFNVGLGFIYLPSFQWRIELKQNFSWNQSAYDVSDKGILSETRLGTMINANLFFTPSLAFPYLHASLHNEVRLYPVTRNGNFQWEYEGTVRFTGNPYIKMLGLFAEAGFCYLSYDTPAAKYDSFSFIWRTGVQFTYQWKKQNETPTPVEPEKKEEPPAPEPTQKVPEVKKPALYYTFRDSTVQTSVRLYGVYFNAENALSQEPSPKLDALALYLKDYPNAAIVVVSYVENSIRQDEKIMHTSAERTSSIKNYLTKQGIPEVQIKRSPSAIIFNPKLTKTPYIEIKILKK